MPPNEPCADRLDRFPDRLALVASRIIQNHNVTFLEGRQQELLDVAEEARAVDRAVKDARGRDAIIAQRGEECHGFPVPMWHKCLQALALLSPATQWCHVGLGPGFVNKDEPGGINHALILVPPISAPRDIRPCLLSPKNRFF